MANKLDTTGTNYIVKSDAICATEDRIRTVLASVYETARKKSIEFRPSSLYSVYFSVSLTLGIALLTSNFKPFFSFSAETVQKIVTVCFVIIFVTGVISLVKFYSGKNIVWDEDRDAVVEDKIKMLKPQPSAPTVSASAAQPPMPAAPVELSSMPIEPATSLTQSPQNSTPPGSAAQPPVQQSSTPPSPTL